MSAMCGSVFDPSTSSLAGLPPATVQAWLLSAQTALMQLSTGAKVVTASYSQGDGAQSVTYTAADQVRLQGFIALLQAQLGVRRRAPIRFMFR